jgi:hypothetical protein
MPAFPEHPRISAPSMSWKKSMRLDSIDFGKYERRYSQVFPKQAESRQPSAYGRAFKPLLIMEIWAIFAASFT